MERKGLRTKKFIEVLKHPAQPKPSTGTPMQPACPHVTNLTAKVISRSNLSCDQTPHRITGDKNTIQTAQQTSHNVADQQEVEHGSLKRG